MAACRTRQCHPCPLTAPPAVSSVVGRGGSPRACRLGRGEEVLTEALDVSVRDEVRDEAGGETEEGFMDVLEPFPADA